MSAAPTDDQPLAQLIARGVARALAQLGFATLAEVALANGRRADLLGLGRSGELVIVEVKSSVQDFRSDEKWREYREFCDRFYFAVPSQFPRALIPEDCGLIVADGFGAEILRECPATPLPSQRRKAMTLRFAILGSERLRRLIDPESEAAGPL